MYITGTQSDFASRMHQLTLLSLPTGAQQNVSGMNHLNSFLTEGRTYIASGFVTTQESGKWETEARNLVFRLSGNGTAMLIQRF